MTRAETLIRAAMPAIWARLLGYVIATIAGTGTTQGAGAPIGDNTLVNLTTASSQTACLMPSDKGLGHEVTISVASATTGLVFPQTGGTIQGGSANASFSLAQNKVAKFTQIAALTWVAILTA